MVKDFLNKKNSTRNLTNEEFVNLLPLLAEELSKIDFHFNFTEDELNRDWHNLLRFNREGFYTASTTRVGMKLCEHFFPNFFDVKNNKGESFKNFWSKEDLQKVLKWNRSSHSTPYMSEIRRGVYFCNGLTKNTMYRPHMAKMICDYYKPNSVLDPCSGWGGRLLGSIASGATYTGFETNPETYDNLKKLINFLGIKNATIYNVGSENIEFDGGFDLVITSPPYFDLEIYSDDKEQSENKYSTYNDWVTYWLNPVVEKSILSLNKGGTSCWNVHNIGEYTLIDDVISAHKDMGFTVDREFGLTSSVRQTNQNSSKNKRKADITLCFKKLY